jgi:hypothetical protein
MQITGYFKKKHKMKDLVSENQPITEGIFHENKIIAQFDNIAFVNELCRPPILNLSKV